MERLALFLGTSGVRVDRVFHGPRRRTKETAEILGRSISDAVEIEALPVLDTDAPLDSLLSTIDAWTEDALLVGHFPTVEELTASLVGAGSQGRLSFSPGTTACVGRSEGTWRLLWMLRPELLGRSDLFV